MGLETNPALATGWGYSPGPAPWDNKGKPELKRKLDAEKKQSLEEKKVKVKEDALKYAVKVSGQWRRLYQKLVKKTNKTKGEMF